jgi:MraZ protein
MPCYPIIFQENRPSRDIRFALTPKLSHDIPSYPNSSRIAAASGQRVGRARRGKAQSGVNIFTGQYQGRLDAKGRVSIPAPYRSILRQRSHDGETMSLMLRSHHQFDCIEGWAAADLERYSERLDTLADFSPELNDLALVIFGAAIAIPIDNEGRIVLPEQLLGHAKIDKTLCFVGTRKTFQIWQPEAFERRHAQARANAASVTLAAALP